MGCKWTASAGYPERRDYAVMKEYEGVNSWNLDPNEDGSSVVICQKKDKEKVTLASFSPSSPVQLSLLHIRTAIFAFPLLKLWVVPIEPFCAILYTDQTLKGGIKHSRRLIGQSEQRESALWCVISQLPQPHTKNTLCVWRVCRRQEREQQKSDC